MRQGDSYIDDGIQRLGEATWLTDVGVPLLVTMLGLGLAAVLVNRQIQHDRDLRRADRLSVPVATFGQAVLAALDEAWGKEGDDPYWDLPGWPGWTQIYEARKPVAVVLQDSRAFDEILAGARDTAWAWRACVQRRASMVKGGTLVPVSAASLGIDAALTPLWHDLRRAAEQLVAWDGLEPLPAFAPWPHLHVPLPKSKRKVQNERWMGFYADTFERVARKNL